MAGRSGNGSSPRAGEQMRLMVLPINTGGHMAGWRHPDAYAGGLHDIGYFLKVALAAERGKFDAFFLADMPGFRQLRGRDAFSRLDVVKLEPITLLSALAVQTKHVGLVATASTSFTQPYHVARMFASLDHISGGRAGWNAVTSTSDVEARNFNFDKHLDHGERYDRAREFVDVVIRLWDSWEDGAILKDKVSGRYFDPDRVHALDHKGRHFSVAGPLNVGRAPQGRPIIAQAGGSDVGRQMGAETADIIFFRAKNFDDAREYYGDMKSRAAAAGRNPDHLKLNPGIQVVIGATEKEAVEKEAYLDSLIDSSVSVGQLEMLLGDVDLSAYPLDGPVPDVPETNANKTLRRTIMERSRQEKLTIRDMARFVASSRSGIKVVGSAEQVADTLEHWFVSRAADGFVIGSSYFPGGFDDFVDQVVPVLQQRGLFRREYEGHSLRENLGLPRPENVFVRDPSLHREPRIWGSASSHPAA